MVNNELKAPTMYDLSVELIEIQRQMSDNPEDMDGVLDQWLAVNAMIPEKVDAYAGLSRTINSQATMYENEAKRFEEEAKYWKDKAAAAKAADKRLKDRMQHCMGILGVTEIPGKLFTAKLQGNGGVQKLVTPDDPCVLPSIYKRITIDADNEAIRAALEAGVEIPGCELLPRGSSVRFK